MSRPNATRKSTAPGLLTRSGRSTLTTIPEASTLARRPSGGGNLVIPADGGPKAQRTSKTTTKLVELPLEPQTKPLPGELEDESSATLVTKKGAFDYKSEGERMSKAERQRAGYKRLTAYCVSESFRMKLLSAFLKREHNVATGAFDEALYVVSMSPAYCLVQLLKLPCYRCITYPSFQDTTRT